MAINACDNKCVISRSEAMEQGLKRYFTGKPCKNGHIRERYICGDCIGCGDVKSRNKERNKKYREENKEIVKMAKALYRKKNKVQLALKNKEYKKNNKEKIKVYRDKTRWMSSLSGNEWRQKNPLNIFTRGTIARLELAKTPLRIDRAERDVGYTQKMFTDHIESLWLEGMSWDNRSEWHIDHIKPITQCIKEGITCIKIINALSNLQPLWAKDNLSKGAKYNSSI